LQQAGEGVSVTARDEILVAARELASRGLEPFAPADIIRELRANGSTYPDSTLRTFIVSAMCINAPRHHTVHYPDLERIGHGQYRVAETAGGPPQSVTGRSGRASQRAGRRDLQAQEQILRTIEERGGQADWPDPDIGDDPDANWQVDDLVRRAYIRKPEDDDGVARLELTPVGRDAARNGLPDEPAGRRTILEPHELELLHQLMWDAAEDVPEDDRRRHSGGIKWILEEHFHVDTADGAGPHGKARKDAVRRLEAIGLIEQIGGGTAKRTGNSWVTNPGMVSYPW